MGGSIISSNINPKDVVESFIRSKGPGGQHVNKVATCVSLLHLPTGILVKCQESRRQDLNRKRAWAILSERLAEIERDKEQRRIAIKEKHRRQNRKLSKNAQEKRLEIKKRNSGVKKNRSKVKYED